MHLFSSLCRSREFIGLLAGSLVLCCWPLQRAMLVEPALLLLAIAFLASVAGFVVAGLSAGSGMLPAQAVRQGVWGAAVVGVVATSVFALMVRNLPEIVPHIRVLVAGGLSILPGMFCGMFSAGFAVVVLARRGPSIPKTLPSKPVPASLSVWIVRAVILALAGAAVLWPAKVEVSSSGATARPAPVAASLPQQPPPSFNYAVPSDLITANALQWKLGATRNFSDINPRVLAFSRDDRWIVYVSDKERVLQAIDLHSTATKQGPLMHSIDRLSFDPSGDRVFVVSDSSPRRIGISDLTANRYIDLPQPKGRGIPDGNVHWWKDNEVLFITGDSVQFVLSLDTLEVSEAGAVESWSKADSSTQVQTMRQAARALRETQRWAWKSASLIDATELLDETSRPEWSIKRSQHLAMALPDRDSRFVFHAISAQSGDTFFSTRDGSKVLRFRDGNLQVSYFTAGPMPMLQWKIRMPHAIDECPMAAEVQNALKAGTLSALIYAPLINPLNNKVIGPERETVRAVVKVKEWKDKTAIVYLAERYSTLGSSDIVADLSVLDGDHPEWFALHTPQHWWAPLPDPVTGSDALASIPTLADKSKQAAVVKDEQQKAQRGREEQEERERKLKEEEQRRMRAQAEESQKPSAPVVAAQPAVYQPIKDFVLKHHQKAQNNDVAGMVSDYAIKVDHFTNGIKDRAWILHDELNYHATHVVLEESVDGDIRINPLPGGNNFTATYQLRVRTLDKATNRPGGGVFEINLIIINTPSGLQIARQRSEKKL